MSDLIITARTLKSLVDPVLPLAGRDDMMPVLTAVQVRGRASIDRDRDRPIRHGPQAHQGATGRRAGRR